MTGESIQNRVVRYLIHGLGAVEKESKSGRYRKFALPYTRDYCFVGRNGSVRVGRSVSNSANLTVMVHARMQAWEFRNGLK